MEIQKIITDFLLREIIHDHESIDASENLIESGLLDSIQIVKLIMFMERQFHISFEEEDMLPKNFETLYNMVDFVNRKSEI